MSGGFIYLVILLIEFFCFLVFLVKIYLKFKLKVVNLLKERKIDIKSLIFLVLFI